MLNISYSKNYKVYFILFSFILYSSCAILDEDDFDIMPMPELIRPVNNEFIFINDTTARANVELYWKRSTYAQSQLIWIATDTSFQTNFKELTTSWDNIDFETDLLNDTTQYFWKVKNIASPLADYESSPFSEVFTFTVGVPDEIECYKCGIYQCVAEVDLTENGNTTPYQNVPLTITVNRIGLSSQYNIIYNMIVGSYNLNTAVTAQDDDDIYRTTDPGSFYIGNQTSNIGGVGLSQVSNNWGFLENSEVEGSIIFTKLTGGFEAACFFTGEK